MINIFSRINKELMSWVAIYRFLRGLDRYGPNLYKDINTPHQGANPNPDGYGAKRPDDPLPEGAP